MDINKMLIAIPSISRFKDLTQGTLNWLPYMINHTRIFVPRDQFNDYVQAAFASGLGQGKFEPDMLVAVPDSFRIAETRKFMAEYARDHGFTKIAMIDDDLKIACRISEDSWKLRHCTTEDIKILLDEIENDLNTHAQVGLSLRQGNNNLGVGTAEQLNEIGGRCISFTAYDVELFLSCEHGRVEVMEDMDVTLQLLRRGYPNLIKGWYCHDQKMTNAPGGCSTYRTHEVQDRSARKLAELHPEFVKLRIKENKTDKNGFGTRTEVTVQWKKAFKSSHAGE